MLTSPGTRLGIEGLAFFSALFIGCGFLVRLLTRHEGFPDLTHFFGSVFISSVLFYLVAYLSLGIFWVMLPLSAFATSEVSKFFMDFDRKQRLIFGFGFPLIFLGSQWLGDQAKEVIPSFLLQ